jgi:hypothetical protein
MLDQLKTALGKYKPLPTDWASHNIEDRIDEILNEYSSKGHKMERVEYLA